VPLQDRQKCGPHLFVASIHDPAGFSVAENPTVLLPLPLGTGSQAIVR
jgi:hypothetical protein